MFECIIKGFRNGFSIHRGLVVNSRLFPGRLTFLIFLGSLQMLSLSHN